MSLTNITPSTGQRSAVAINLNRLRLQPGERVVYWSTVDQAVKIGMTTGYGSDDANFFYIDDAERVMVTSIWARIPDRFTVLQRAAVIADFTAIGRGVITDRERMTVCDRHGLAS